MRRAGDRVLGPYVDRRGYRVIEIRNGKRVSHVLPTQAAALDLRSTICSEIDKSRPTVGWAIEQWLEELLDEGTQPQSVATTAARLRGFFYDPDERLSDLSPESCAALYLSYRRRPTRTGKPPATDTHRNALSQAKTFLSFCRDQNWITENPLIRVKGKGRRSRGKPQLTKDEAVKLYHYCRDDASDVAVALLCALVLGLRSGEILGLTERDIGSDRLYVRNAKTQAGNRVLGLPVWLRDMLFYCGVPLKLTKHTLYTECKRICRAAGVPEVTPHGLRGTHATLAKQAGLAGNLVASSLGHSSEKVTEKHYYADGVAEEVNRGSVLRVLKGGR